MAKEEIKLTQKQYEIVRVIAQSEEEGVKVGNIAKELGVTLQSVNGSVRGLVSKGVIEIDKESDPRSPVYWLRPDIEIKEDKEQETITVFANSAVGTEIAGEGGVGEIGEGKEYSTVEEFIKFKGLRGVDDLKRTQLEEWLQTYSVGRQPRNVVLRQYETNPQVKYTRRGLYDALRRGGVKEDFATGIVEQVFLIEDQYAPFLPDFDRDLLIQRKNPNAAVRGTPFFDDDRFREPLQQKRGAMGMGMEAGTGAGTGAGMAAGMGANQFMPRETGAGVMDRITDRRTIRSIIQEELRHDDGDNFSGHGSGSVTPVAPQGVDLRDFELVEEPILDAKGNPRHDTKGKIIYRKRYVRRDEGERAEKEWRGKFEEQRDKLATLEKQITDSKLKSDIDFMKGKLDALENNPSGGISDELSVELQRIKSSSTVIERLLEDVTSLAKVHMGVPEGGTRVALTDKELAELEKKRAEEG